MLLKPVLAPGNVDKTMAAPVTVIIAWDTEFHEHFPRLFPQADMRSYFAGNKPLIEENAFRNSSLQAAYFILAARALGLDCGPMSGFDANLHESSVKMTPCGDARPSTRSSPKIACSTSPEASTVAATKSIRVAGAIKATHPEFRYQPIAGPEELGNGGRAR